MVRLGPHSFYRRPSGREELYASRDWLRAERPLPLESAAAERARRALDVWLALEERMRDQVAAAPLRDLSSEVEEELRALGYIE